MQTWGRQHEQRNNPVYIWLDAPEYRGRDYYISHPSTDYCIKPRHAATTEFIIKVRSTVRRATFSGTSLWYLHLSQVRMVM